MRAIVLRRSGPPHMLRVEEIPDPIARPGEVLVQVKAAGVNFADVLARQGLYPDAPQRPFIPGFETGGEVLAVGLAVIDLARRAGLEIVGAASSHFKRERLQSEGVKHVVDSRRAHVDRVARDLYGRDGGFDIIIDSVGGRTISQGIRALRPGGRLVSCGVATLSKRGILGALGLLFSTPRIDPFRMLARSRGFYGVHLGQL